MLAGMQAPGKMTSARETKDRNDTKYSPWSSIFGAGRGSNDHTEEKFTRDPKRVVALVKKERPILSQGLKNLSFGSLWHPNDN
jgi:hypothetical protein